MYKKTRNHNFTFRRCCHIWLAVRYILKLFRFIRSYSAHKSLNACSTSNIILVLFKHLFTQPNEANSFLTDCIMDKTLKKFEVGKFITTALKSILKLIKLQSLVVKCCKNEENIALQRLRILYILLYYALKIDTVFSMHVGINFPCVIATKIYKICNLYRLTFSTFYNVSQPNFAI